MSGRKNPCGFITFSALCRCSWAQSDTPRGGDGRSFDLVFASRRWRPAARPLPGSWHVRMGPANRCVGRAARPARCCDTSVRHSRTPRSTRYHPFAMGTSIGPPDHPWSSPLLAPGRAGGNADQSWRRGQDPVGLRVGNSLAITFADRVTFAALASIADPRAPPGGPSAARPDHGFSGGRSSEGRHRCR